VEVEGNNFIDARARGFDEDSTYYCVFGSMSVRANRVKYCLRRVGTVSCKECPLVLTIFLQTSDYKLTCVAPNVTVGGSYHFSVLVTSRSSHYQAAFSTFFYHGTDLIACVVSIIIGC
jgi:hypothetical protein